MARERGVALITVLLILALLVTLAAYVVDDEFLMLRRVGNSRDSEQAYQMAMGSERWAAAVLERDGRESKTDHLNEAWNRLGPAVKVEEGTLATAVEDRQGRFNLNNLRAGRDEVWYPAFTRLLQILEIDETLADAVVDWIDPDQNVTGARGREDGGYLLQDPPYRSADRLFSDVSELRWVAGFDSEVIERLAPYVSALPADKVLLNVNTSPPLLLRILGKSPLGEAAAESLAAARGEEGFKSVQEFLAAPELAAQGPTAEKLITVSSSYFMVTSTARYGRITFILRSLIQRPAGDSPATILLRKRGLS